jgi:SH3-like domain-containing protein
MHYPQNKNLYKSIMNFIKIRTVVLLITCIFLGFTSLAQAKMLSIIGNDVNMRSGPGTNYRVMWELGNGFPLKVLKKKGSWYRVSDFEGTIGWVHEDVTTPTHHMIVKVHKNSKRRINVRSGAGTKYRIIAKAYYGVVLETLQQKHGWVQVKHEKGVTGWVKRSLLWGF